MRRLLWFAMLVLVAVAPRPAPSSDESDRLRGGVLRVGVPLLGTLDPARARSVEEVLVADQLFDSLTAYDPVSLAPVPSLAARWESTPDQRLWTFHLREGAVFANGRDVSALDVKYSLERVARRGSGSPGAELLQMVSGYAAFRNGGAELGGITTPALDVVHIALDDPVSELASVVASPTLSVVPRESVDAPPPAAAFARSPVGSGPFRLSARRGRVLSLEPSPGADVGVGGVEVVQYDDLGAVYAAFTRGELDWARVPPEEVDGAASRYGEGAFRPYVAELFYGFNLSNPKLTDVRFREAIVRGIDRRAVMAAVYHGTVRPAEGIVLDGLPGVQAEACARCGHDPEKARALVAEAFPPSKGPPPTVILDFDAEPIQEAIARAVQANLADVGVTVSLRPTAPDAYDRLVLSGAQEVFRLGWVAAYPSPDAVLWPLFHSASASNLTGYADAAVDAILGSARAEADPARRAAAYQEAERAIMDAVPVIPLAQLQVQSVVSRRVRGLVLTTVGTFDASVVTLADRR